MAASSRAPGIWGVNIPVGWGFAIVNFVWWIGIGHAGTLISAILLLFRQKWRMSISRFAEAMTIFAVMCAAIFPVFHTGRPWLAAYWLFPYPNSMNIWPNFRSPLIWDVFAVSTYATVSVLFWYVGLIPDLATMRDRAAAAVGEALYGVLALGWRGSAHALAALRKRLAAAGGPGDAAGPLGPHGRELRLRGGAWSPAGTRRSSRRTSSPAPSTPASRWCSRSPFPIRAYYGMEDFITMRHIQNCAKVMLCTGLIVVYGYSVEAFMGWYSGNPYEDFMIANRTTGNYWYMYWFLIFCNGIMPQTLWFKKVRTNIPLLFCISLVVNVGMWLERFVIVVTSLSRDFLPSSWGMYAGTMWDWMTYIGTLGLFTWLMFLFLRLLPMISMFEMRTIMPSAKIKSEGAH